MNRTNRIALKATGFFVGVIIAATTLPAAAANLVAYYPVDDYYMSGVIAYTTNVVPGSPLPVGQMNYDGGNLYGGSFVPAIFGNGYNNIIQNQSYINFGAADPFSWTGSFTYMLWVYDPFPAAGPVQGLQTMVLSKQSANLNHYFRFIIRDDNLIQIGAIRPDGALQDRNTLAITSVVADPRERWTHFAFTASLSGSTVTWGVYVDGQPLGFAGGVNTATIDAARAAIQMRLGVTAGGQPQGYPNFIHDDIRFYNGVLTAEQIRAIPGVTPVSASIVVTNSVVTVSWNSFVGNRYQLRKTTDLASSSWTDVGSQVTATSTTTSASEAQSADPTYYRVEVLP